MGSPMGENSQFIARYNDRLHIHNTDINNTYVHMYIYIYMMYDVYMIKTGNCQKKIMLPEMVLSPRFLSHPFASSHATTLESRRFVDVKAIPPMVYEQVYQVQIGTT